MKLYRAAYLHQDGTRSRITFRSEPHDAMRWAADYVRWYIGGYLLTVCEEPAPRPYLALA